MKNSTKSTALANGQLSIVHCASPEKSGFHCAITQELHCIAEPLSKVEVWSAQISAMQHDHTAATST
jgi:hypothetical protein